MALFGKFWDRIAPGSNPRRADAEQYSSIADYLGTQVQPGDPGLALAIVKSSTVVEEAGFGVADVRTGQAITPQTIFHLASCGKQFTATGILMLVEAGKLKLDDPLGRYLPALTGYGPQVTIRHLLNHTSGIRDLYDEEGAETVLARCERPRNADIIETYAELGCPMTTARAGDRFNYSNSGYELLGSVIERVSGQSYQDFFQRIFERLGMPDTFSAPDPRTRDRRCATGYVLDEHGGLVACEGTPYDDLVGSGSFYTTVRDLARYDRAIAGNSLISAASMQQALTPGRTNDGRETNCGLGWYIGSDEGLRFADHQGEWIGFYSYICRYLDQPLSMFFLSNNPSIDLVELANIAAAIYR